MQKKLRDVGNIKPGITLRKDSFFAYPDSKQHILKIKHIDGLQITPDHSSPVTFDTSIEKYTAHENDILVTSRGEYTKAAVLPQHSDTFIASSQLYAITLKDTSKVLPAYLAIYLSSKAAEQHFRLHRKGTLVQIITKDALSTLPVCIPPIEHQKHIIRLRELIDQERQLQNDLLEKHTLQFEQAIKSIQNPTNI